MPSSIRNRTPTFIAWPTYNKADVNRRWKKMPTCSYHKHLPKILMALHATNAPDAIIVPCITKIRQRDIDKILEMHQFKMQAKKPQSQQSRKRNVWTICPVQLLKIKEKEGKALATLDSSSNTSFISKNIAKKLGIRGYKTHLKMNLAGSEKKAEETELMDVAVSSTVEQNVQKSLQAYEIKKPCSPARKVSRTLLESYPHLKLIMNNLHLSGGTVDVMIGTDFAQAFSGMLVISGKSREPISKLNCGWYVIGTFSQHNQLSGGVG